MDVASQAAIAGVLAGLVGLAELVSRYRSDPAYALGSLAAWFYIALNASAGVIALLVIHAFDWKFGQTEHIDLFRIFVAGFGAIALFRSSFFVAKIGGLSVGVGPSLVLGSLLDACDRDVDRRSAEKIAEAASDDALAELNPDSVISALPVLCLALMQNFPPSDQAQLAADISAIAKNETLASQAKMRAVIVQLAKHLGKDVVMKVLGEARTIFVATPPTVKANVIAQAKHELAEQAASRTTDSG